MIAGCAQGHRHPNDAERSACDARFHDARGLMKMSQVNFAGPEKIHRVHHPGRPGRRFGLEVIVFSEEEIVPWRFEDDVVTDPGRRMPGLAADDEEEIVPEPDSDAADPGGDAAKK